jgi:glycerophosphoryl diester phosphodiesterase
LIFVCEPQCKAFSHEKFNSGFLHGLRLAFPDEQIRFFGDASHIDCLQKILARDKIAVGNIAYLPIRFRTDPGAMRMLGYRKLLANLLRAALAAGTDRIFFLSFNPEILYLLKKFKEKSEFRVMKFTLVLHGSFENVAEGDPGTSAPARAEPVSDRTLTEKIRRSRLADIPVKAWRLWLNKAKTFSPWRLFSRRFFREKKMLLWRHSGDFRYICLSSHIAHNARRYLDAAYLNFHTVTLPMIFADITPRPHNKFAKFAMFGYGDSSALRRLLKDLSSRKIGSPYEIRVIGMDNRGIEDFPNVTCPSAGKPLERGEMESLAKDIDMFLILYDKSRYRLSCSGSIMEALSQMKPVLHLDNDCINRFNTESNPIGIRCGDLYIMADKLQEIVESYSGYGPALDAFRENMRVVRRECSIEQSVDALRASFTW